MTTEEKPVERGDCHGLRLVFFLLGVFVAASVGLAIALGLALKHDDDGKAAVAGVTTEPESVCTNPSCVLRAGELLQAMDRSVDPCTDFYLYSCGKWTRTHSIPESASSYTRFGEIRDSVQLELKGLMEKPYDRNKEGSPIRKLKNFYQSCLNETKLTELGTEPLKQLVNSLQFPWPLTTPGGSLNAQLDLETVLAKLGHLQLNPLVALGVDRDEFNSSAFILWIDQASLGIDRDYMVKGRSSPEVSTYEELLRNLAVRVLGLNDTASLRTDIGHAVQFEVDVANLTATNVQRRNSDLFYKRMTVSDLQTAVPKLNWLKYLTAHLKPANLTHNFTNDTLVGLFAQDYLNNVLDLYERTDKIIVANYLLLRLLRGYYFYLSMDIRDLSNPLKQVLYGVAQSEARWKQCVSNMADMMPTATGLLYVSAYFTPAAKQKALEIIGYIRNAVKQMIRNVNWMDQPTKDRALEKADAILELIAYPDYQFDETVLEIFYKNVDFKPDLYFQNALDHARDASEGNAELLNEVPVRNGWGDAASTVNAFYSSNENTITFPAGILQPPFYAEDFPMSMVFGGIGMVIGHEITHGFDDQGRKFDKLGNSVPWWSNSSVQQYQTLAQCFVDQYSQRTIATGQHVNGQLTLGENIADNGGIKASFMAFKTWQSQNKQQSELPGLGLTNEQLFFVNFAQGWCTLITDESSRDRVYTDPHSPADVRVRVPVANSPEFAEAFHCPLGSPMNPATKCQLW